MTAAPDLLRQAMETYALELQLANGLSTDALEKAIASALEAHERTVVQRIANQAATFAHDPGEGREQAGAVLLWFSEQLLTELPPQTADSYQPVDGDLVEVTLTGRVAVYDDDEEYNWSVIDDRCRDEYFFLSEPRRIPRIRVLARNEADG